MHVVKGPAWGGGLDGRYPGRYPLSVERHVLRSVGELLPGVTTVTRNARYYSLHSYTALQAKARGMTASESLEFLRRSETLIAAISILHEGQHAWLPRPHGADYLESRIKDGLNLGQLSRPGAYAGRSIGYRGQYQASEMLLGLLPTGNSQVTAFDTSRLDDGFRGLYELTREEHVSEEQLRTNCHLCVCGSRTESDGAVLRELLLAQGSQPETDHDKRRQTVRMVLRLIQLGSPTSINTELVDSLNYSPVVHHDELLLQLDAVQAWQGVTLRNRSVSAWRALWAGLVEAVPGLCHRSQFPAPLVDVLPNVSVGGYVRSFPPVWTPDGTAHPAELEQPAACESDMEAFMATILLGSLRLAGIPDHVKPYFESKNDSLQEMSPTWLLDRVHEWDGRPLKDFARHIVELLLRRANRLSLRKARFDASTGSIKIPTRIFFRDDLVFKDSNEGGGSVSLRLAPLVHILSGIDLLVRDENEQWQITDRGAEALA
ncbi:hypothetical protein QFZ60_003088 [Arthrobacter sp. B2I5]|nr:hypothetical protein [Arthrobacter sp. B2I5]